MWHLRRIHMESVGHPDARFDPLTVELTDAAGEPRSSVLWLENMGGKTSWLSLVFSTLRPSLTEFLGKPDKQLGDYILGTDTAHVILEFSQVAGIRTLTGSTTRLVLGQVIQWRQHRQEKARESAQLNRQLWGALVPPSAGSLSFEEVVELVRTDGAQRRPLADFTSQLADRMEGDVFRPDSNQSRWAEWLRHHGLDPDVFADQLKMSADEGSISERFHFETGDQLVKWAMPYIIPPKVPDGIAAVVDQVKDTLAQRPSLLAQQLFCSTVEGKLAYAAAQQNQLDEQRAEATVVWDSSLQVADQFRVAQTAAESAGEHHRTEAARFEKEAREAQSLRNQRQQQWRHAQLVAARLHHSEIAALHQQALVQLEEDQRRVDAWDLTAPLLRLGVIETRLRQIDSLLAEVDDQTRPLREAVTVAEERLGAKLGYLLHVEQATRLEAEERLTRQRAKTEQSDSAFKTANATHASAASDLATAEANLDQLDAEIAEAFHDGLLGRGQPLEEAVSARAAEVQRLEAEVGRLVAAAKAWEAAEAGALDTVEQARQKQADCRAAFEKASARSTAVLSAAERLLEQPEVAAAFDTVHPDVWHDGPTAADRLAKQAHSAAIERLSVELRSATDQRAVDWLDRTGLLPPSQDVEDALAVLEEHGIRSAFSGWELLRTQVPADRHVEVISRHPEVATGIVLTDPAELIAAIETLAGSTFTAPIVLSAEGLDLGGGPHPGIVVVPGPAALHDESAGLGEGQRRQAQLDAASAERGAVIEREQAAREARAQVLAFLKANPADSVAWLRSEESTCRVDLDEAEAGLRSADSAYAVVAALARGAAADVQLAREDRAEGERTLNTVRKLARSQTRRQHEELAATKARVRIDDAKRQMRAAESARATAVRQVESAQASIGEVGIRISQIESSLTRHGLIPPTDSPTPDAPVDTLERALEVARQELLAAAPPDQVVKEREGLMKESAESAALLRHHDEEVVNQARSLLAGPEGANGQTRDTATRAAKGRLSLAQRREALEHDALKKAEADLAEKEEIPQSRRRALDEEPSTAEEARALAERLATEASAALTQLDEANDRQTHHGRQADQADRTAQAFRREAEDLVTLLKRHATLMSRPTDVLDERRHASAWSGTPAQAEAERRQRETLLDEAAEYMRIATDERNDALNDVRHLANEQRDLLASDLPTLLPRLTDGHPDQRGKYAGELASQLHAYALTIENQLADLERHRRIVIDHLAGKVKETVKLLERMQRRTRLPAGLDEWSDRPFLQLIHPRLPETTTELSGRVATVVDQICDEPSKTPTSGMDLLYAAVSAAVGGPFHASILKPHKRLTDERVDISEMASFSGGQKVTAALVMFAALTRMRTEAHSSGQQSNAALPLLLDNPIGKANQATLMEVQQRVADAFGLQLVYTTGLHDVGALASFKNIVRLDGRENPRSGRVHVVLDGDDADLVYLDSIRLIQHDGAAG